MKKLMFAMAVAAAGAAMAEGISSGIVGYNVCNETQASETEETYSLMAIPFEGVAGKGVKLDDIAFSNLSSGRASKADHILLWVKQADGSYNYEDWYCAGGETGWKCTDGTLFADRYPDGLPVGTTFWYNAAKKEGGIASSVTTSGAVSSDEYVKRGILRGQYNFVSYPYPTALKLDDADQVDWGESASGRASKADHILMWVKQADGSYNYDDCYNTGNGWKCTDGTMFAEKYPNGIAVGTGFWIDAAAKEGSDSFDVTFKSPLAKVNN